MPRFGIAAMFTVAALFVAEATLRELCAPLPLWKGRIASKDAIRVRGLSPPSKLSFGPAEADPSSGADFVHAIFSHKGRRCGVCAEAKERKFVATRG